MITREDLLRSKEYWMTTIQNQLFNHIEEYMKKEGLTRTALAEQLGVTKGYVSQVLNGDFDHRMLKYIDLLIATNVVPKIEFENLNDKIKKQTTSITASCQVNRSIENESINWHVHNQENETTKIHTISMKPIDTASTK